MESFKNFFNNWIDEKTANQIAVIDKICSELNIDASIWFNSHYRRNFGDYTGTDCLTNMMNDFIFYVEKEFENLLLEYMSPDGYSIYKTPYLNIIWELQYNDKFYIADSGGKENFLKKIENLSLTQKAKLMENKLFSHIVNQTNLEIFSKKDIRVLKLKNLNECVTNI